MKIAIDGPAGAGKSTVAKLLAAELGYVYIDTGAMYRALTFKAIQKGISLNDDQALSQLARNTSIHFEPLGNQDQLICCDGMDVTESIRTPEISQAVGIVAAHTRVRTIMVELQKRLAAEGNVVMDGRDIGEVVIPDADFKFFMTASLNERVRRRQAEWAVKGQKRPAENVESEIVDRDYADSTREFGALKELADSIVINTTGKSVHEVENMMLSIIRGK